MYSPARRACIALFIAVAGVGRADAQLISPRTVPVFQDEQFQLYPSSRPGLGSVRIALDDTLGDVFVNPAKAIRLRGTMAVAAPYGHAISGDRGGGRTLPVTVLFGTEDWGGAVLGAIQQTDRAGPVWNRSTSERTATNQYLTASISRRFSDGTSLGASAFHADLSAVDGVDLLYAGSDRIDQSGNLNDFRMGALKEWQPGHAAELLVVRSSTRMRHDVHFTTWVWDSSARQSRQRTRQDINLDETDVTGLHAQYMLPVGTEGWRLGFLGILNYFDHPKIPNYVLQNLPRDPGSTRAYNVGLGASRNAGPLTVAADVVMEPITSNTFADMTTDVKRADGTVIPAGEKTVENHFTFHNSRAALGVGWRAVVDSAAGTSVALNFGLSMYAISYDLLQTNNITRTLRAQHENWVESGPTLGIRFHMRDVDVSYAFRATCGTGSCDIVQQDRVFVTSAPAPSGIIAAPASPLFLQSGRETSHHLTVSVPFR
ncbi:MAG TPA: hypothetical protein VF929_10470 [Gemmatimonadaceae bacterium]